MQYLIKELSQMTIDEKIGQLIMCGTLKPSLDADEIAFIKQYKVGNFILFSRNYENTSQMKKFTKELYDIATLVSGSFPLISIDQEGGMVTRLFKDVTFPASPLTTSATCVKNAPYVAGKIIGSDMIKLGLNLNLAPCLEINKNLASHLVNVRSYGACKELVLKNTKAFIKGLHDGGVLSCMKHFPGSGAATKDSHLDLPIIDKPMQELENNEMYPFLNNFESDSLMSSHCLFSSYDKYPTTLSHKFLTEYMRNKKGYNGLIISDGMEMKAILDFYGIKEGTILALLAGCDILLVCHEMALQIEAFEAIKEALASGRIKENLIDEKVERIILAKKKLLKQLNKKCDFNKEYKIVKKEHRKMQKIVENSYTLIKGEAPILDDKTLIIAPKVKVASIVEDEFDKRDLTQALRLNFERNTIYEFNDNLEFKDMILKRIDDFSKIIIFSYDAYKDNVQKELINEILKTKKDTFVISLKGPMDQKEFHNLVNYACLYEYTPNAIITVIKQLKGKIKLKGHLPNE